MRNLSLLLGLVLLVHGVFGVDEVKSVAVMVGDSLTLNTDFTKTKGDELQWRIEGESDVIAQIDREVNKITVPGNNEERFRDRLKLDHQTGSLTITNIRTTDSGVYELKIKDSMNENKYRFIVTVRDVFLVDTDGVKSVSVTEGDSVTLHTGVDIQRDDQILWKSGDQDLNGAFDARWSNIDLNDQTGDLNIKNIRSDQTGVYTVEINTSSMILHRKFHVFTDEEAGVKTVSETNGDSVLLHTHVTHIQQNDPIEWTFGPQNIHVAKTDGKSNSISYNYNDERFKNRLYLNIQNGDLTIKKSSTEHSGLYQLRIITSSYTIQKSFSVAVSGAVSGISGASVVLMIWAVTVVLLQEV